MLRLVVNQTTYDLGIWITACTRAPSGVAGVLGEDNGGACRSAWAEQRDGGRYPLHVLGFGACARLECREEATRGERGGDW